MPSNCRIYFKNRSTTSILLYNNGVFRIVRIVNDEKIKARKKTSNRWFETQNQIGYYKEFAKPKIVYPEISSLFSFTYDETGSFGNDKSFIITEKDNSQNLPKGTENVIASEAKQSNAETTSDVIPAKAGISSPSGYNLLKALLAIFNSNLVKLWIWYNCPELMGGTREIRKVYFENFKIPMDNAAALLQLTALADQIISAKKSGENTASLESKVDEIVYQIYGITGQDERDAVEKG